jgi:hypothetical protein
VNGDGLYVGESGRKCRFEAMESCDREGVWESGLTSSQPSETEWVSMCSSGLVGVERLSTLGSSSRFGRGEGEWVDSKSQS